MVNVRLAADSPQVAVTVYSPPPGNSCRTATPSPDSRSPKSQLQLSAARHVAARSTESPAVTAEMAGTQDATLVMPESGTP